MSESGTPSIPPLDKMFLIGIWVESVLYGMNILIFGSAILVLSRRLQSSTHRSSMMLIVVSTIAFMLSTAYVSVSLRQLLEAFIYGTPGTATLYFANESSRISQSKLGLYTVNVLLQDLMLIWRLWIVYGQRNRIVVIPLTLEALRLGASIVAMVRGGEPGVPIFDPLVHNMSLVDWTSDLAVNIGVTLLIAYRLWSAGHAVSSATSSTSSKPSNNKYMDIIFTIIESGSLFAAATLVTVSLYLSGNVATVVAIDSVAQLATITPLLIIVRVGLGLTHGSLLGRGIASSSNRSRGSEAVQDSSSITFARRIQINMNKSSTTEDGGDEFPLAQVPSGNRKWLETQT